MESMMMMKTNNNGSKKNMQFSKSLTSLLLISLLHGCVLTGSESLDAEQTNTEETATDADVASATAEASENSEVSTDEGKSAELTQAENQVKALEEQLASLKVEWEQQKPALERLVSNEADLEFLVQALADMSQLADEPSRSQYLGQDELTPEKREQSLQALQSLVTTQEELNTLLVELSTVVSGVAANSQNSNAGQVSTVQASTDGQMADNQLVVSEAPAVNQQVEAQSSGAPVADISANQSGQQTAMTPDSSATQVVSTGQTAATPVSADCNCSNSDPASTTPTDPAKARDPSWYAMTTPYAEATPAGSNGTVSQLDSGAASGQPIPGLQVKTFKRRSLPSELAAVGAPIQQYAMAPQFHMSRKSLSDYVSQLAFKLAGNQQLAGNRIGVASFVFFDEQLEQTSSVGNQLAEELSTVLPNYGARVIEYKLTREITVSPTGDLSLSRNTQKLRDSQGMDYVLTGTMVPTRRGLQINSRVVSTRDNVVIASATTLIPAMVLQQL